jgi:hypothetical protein
MSTLRVQRCSGAVMQRRSNAAAQHGQRSCDTYTLVSNL